MHLEPLMASLLYQSIILTWKGDQLRNRVNLEKRQTQNHSLPQNSLKYFAGLFCAIVFLKLFTYSREAERVEKLPTPPDRRRI